MLLRKIITIIFFINLTSFSVYSQDSEADGVSTNSNGQSENLKNSSKPSVKSAKKANTKALFSPQIEWDQPEIKPTNKPKVHEVTLFGVTEKNIQVRVGRQILWVKTNEKNQKKIRKIPVKKLKIENKPIVDMKSDGSFTIKLRLPEGEVQVPVGLISGKQGARYQLVMYVKDKKIELKNQPKIYTECRYCIWLGAGFAYLAYQQDPPQDIKNVEYGAFGFPALSLRVRVKLLKDWNLRFAYHRLTGPELSSGDVTITDKSISWQHMGLEVDYRAISSFRLLGIKFDPALLVGVQNQDLPFLIQTSTNVFTIDSFKFNTASLGGMFFLNSHKIWYYEIFMRLQMAMSSSGDIKLSSGFAFDGSLGAIYRLGENIRLGMFWGGQYHTYKYEINAAPGAYSLLNSKIDLSLGYEF
ncbi:MAG: hypothetical protein H6625_04500 [Bdellovibrionaceae bacterium]|nr:hypothetical protein [Pseudobdellovibrionaceae bacterium]